MAINMQILTCPLCQTEHSAADAKLVPGYYPMGSMEIVIPARYVIQCTECKTPFYRKVEDGADGN